MMDIHVMCIIKSDSDNLNLTRCNVIYIYRYIYIQLLVSNLFKRTLSEGVDRLAL